MIEYHRNLISDEVRTRAYRDAIHATVKPGDVVVDIGCGSGILSFFACQAGASHVYAIDRGHMADVASVLARHAGFEDRITVLHEESTSVELPQRADVLITETMGVLGFDENILGSVLDARRRFLREGAAIVPGRVTLHAMPVELPSTHANHVAWWSEPRFGVDLSPMRTFAANSIGFVQLEDGAAIASSAAIIERDLTTHETTRVHEQATFTASRDGVVHGFGVWFDATLARDITIATRGGETMFWAHGFMPVEVPVNVTRGETIELAIETDDGKGWRWSGSIGGEEFDQTTWFSAPPCIAS